MVLYFTSGATDYEIGAPALPDARWAALRETACRPINTRGNVEAANFLRRTPFEVFEATNHFGDEFTVLALDVNLDDYVAIQEWRSQSGSNLALQNIVRTLGEVGVAVRMVVADILADDAVEPVPHAEMGHGFAMQILNGSERAAPLICKSYHKINSSGFFISTPCGPRMLRKGEIERLQGQRVATEHYATAVQMLGQGVLTRTFAEIFKQLAAFLTR